jgi:RNase P subunit RPR2
MNQTTKWMYIAQLVKKFTCKNCVRLLPTNQLCKLLEYLFEALNCRIRQQHASKQHTLEVVVHTNK